jgi:glycosyltransferase involved in cell wall biosynthesis
MSLTVLSVAFWLTAVGPGAVGGAEQVLPEIVQQGKTGFLVEREAELPEAIRASLELNPHDCRKAVEQFLTSDKMVESYIASYQQILRVLCRTSQAA